MSCKDCSTNYPDEPPVIKNHKIVDTFEEVGQFRNAFVTVREENATYHTDSVGNALAISRNPIFINDFTPEVGTYKNNIVYDVASGSFYAYDFDGNYKTGTLT